MMMGSRIWIKGWLGKEGGNEVGKGRKGAIKGQKIRKEIEINVGATNLDGRNSLLLTTTDCCFIQTMKVSVTTWRFSLGFLYGNLIWNYGNLKSISSTNVYFNTRNFNWHRQTRVLSKVWIDKRADSILL